MASKDNWVDFREIKDRLTMEAALARYGVLDSLKRSGPNLVGCCPIHKGSNPRQFSVNLEKSIWKCFGNCKGGGNVLDFVARMEGVSVREAALKAREWVSGEPAPAREKPAPERKEKEDRAPREDRAINPPLSFELKNLKLEHPFFEERGILPATVKHFGLGYCSRGLMKGRIVIPIHNERGELVAYCGRAVTSAQAEEEGKYKLPAKFVKSRVVYNLNRIASEERRIIVVESFLSVFKLYQLGLSNAVALMGSDLSARQEELLAERLGPDGRAILMFDADESGEACARECLARLGRKLFVKTAQISPHAKKPHHLNLEQLNQVI